MMLSIQTSLQVAIDIQSLISLKFYMKKLSLFIFLNLIVQAPHLSAMNKDNKVKKHVTLSRIVTAQLIEQKHEYNEIRLSDGRSLTQFFWWSIEEEELMLQRKAIKSDGEANN